MKLEVVEMVRFLEGSTRVTAIISKPISSNSNRVMTVMIFLRNTDTVNGRKRNSNSRTNKTKITSFIIGRTKKKLEITTTIMLILAIIGVKVSRIMDGVTISNLSRLRTHSIDKLKRR